MASKSNIPKNNTLRILTDYLEAYESGKKNNNYIRNITPEKYDEFYILLIPMAGIYKDQKHILELKLNFSDHKYPDQSPLVKFHTKVFHTNVSESGSVCVDILNSASAWSPSNNFTTIINSIIVLFEDHNSSSPFNCEASQLHKECMTKYENEKKILLARKYQEKLDVDEEEELKKSCLQPFVDATQKYYRKDILQRYEKYFPHVLSDPSSLSNTQSAAESQSATNAQSAADEAEHFEEIRNIIQGLKRANSKKKPKDAQAQSAQPEDAQSAQTEDAQSSKSKKNKWEKFKSLDKKKTK